MHLTRPEALFAAVFVLPDSVCLVIITAVFFVYLAALVWMGKR